MLIALEAITPTEKALINRRAARYRWLPPHANDGATRISSPPGLDALGVTLLKGAKKDMPQLSQVARAFEAD